MAARIDGIHAERVRKRIKLSQLVQRLQNNALGKIEMSPGAIDSAKFLIARALPPPPETNALNVSGSLVVNVKHYGPPK